ncbi:MAG TPA: hypothetical protein VF473_08160 [Cyclobacteriaceae bacterium]
MMGSEYLVKAVACLLILGGAAGFISGLLGFFGPVVVSINPWLLTSLGFLILLSGYGLMTRDLDEIH